MTPARPDRDARDAIVIARVREGVSLRAIAEELATGRTEIYRVLDRLGISLDAVAKAKADAPKLTADRKHGGDKEPNQWAPSYALGGRGSDKFWGLVWTHITAEKFNEFMLELNRTPGEYSRNGGQHWSPTCAELAERLRVPAETVEDWAENGVDEPWEIAVVRAYARTGIVATTDALRVPPIDVHRALHRANSLRDAAKVTGIPKAMLEWHLEVGAPAKTHGRAYLLMLCDEYRACGNVNMLAADSDAVDATIARMLAEGATFVEIADEVGLASSGVNKRIKKLGLPAARARRGGHQLRCPVDGERNE